MNHSNSSSSISRLSPTGEEIPTVSKTIVVPDSLKGESTADQPHPVKEVRSVSIVSCTGSVFSDAGLENGDFGHVNHRSMKKTRLQRRRKRLSTLLHTHVVLIVVCTLSALDAACVVGQIICDVLLMKESIESWEEMDRNLTTLLWNELPDVLNTSEHDSPESLNLRKIAAILWGLQQISSHYVSPVDVRRQSPAESSHPDNAGTGQRMTMTMMAMQKTNLLTEGQPLSLRLRNLDPMSSSQMMTIGAAEAIGRAGGGEHEEGGVKGSLLYHLTHYFHLGSMIILSALLLECFLKVLAMGKKLLHHKLEIFDLFVVSVSWALDVGFWEGIWAHPETEAATILIVMLPWRVVRIVNSFVLVIQEKDHVELKIVKQRLRLSVKKGKEVLKKAASYKMESKQLQSLCRYYGATDTELISCVPPDRRRRRSLGAILLKPPSSFMNHRNSAISLSPSLSPSTLNILTGLDISAMMADSSSSSSDEEELVISPRDLMRKDQRQELSLQCSGISARNDLSSSRDHACKGRREELSLPDSGNFGVSNSAFAEEEAIVGGAEEGQANGAVLNTVDSAAHEAVSKQDCLTRL